MRKCWKLALSHFLTMFSTLSETASIILNHHLQVLSNLTSLHLRHLVSQCITNALQNNKFSGWSKLKAFANDKIYVTIETEILFGMGRKHYGKGENAGFQHFLLFPQCFQKVSFSGSLKAVTVW